MGDTTVMIRKNKGIFGNLLKSNYLMNLVLNIPDFLLDI